MRELVHDWRHRFDWRATEAALNACPQFKTRIDGIDVHFLHVTGRGANPRPLLLSHGWPGSVLEFMKLIPLLTGEMLGNTSLYWFTRCIGASSWPYYARSHGRYNASKGAVNLLSKSMAAELGPDNIRVNAICPVMGATGLISARPTVARRHPRVQPGTRS